MQKISKLSSKYHKEDQNNSITDSESFKFRAKIAGRTPPGGNTKYLEIAVPIKYLSNSCRTGISLEFTTWKETGAFAITDTKLYVPVVTLLNQYYAKLIKLLVLGFKRTTSWIKYYLKVSTSAQNQYLS